MNKQQYIKRLSDGIVKSDGEEKIRVVADFEKELSIFKKDEEVSISKYGHPFGKASRINASYYANEIRNNNHIFKNALYGYYHLVSSISGLSLPLYFSIPIMILSSLVVIILLIGLVALIGLTAALLIGGVGCLIASITLIISEIATGLLFLGLGLIVSASFGLGYTLIIKYYKSLFKDLPLYLYDLLIRLSVKKEAGVKNVKKV